MQPATHRRYSTDFVLFPGRMKRLLPTIYPLPSAFAASSYASPAHITITQPWRPSTHYHHYPHILHTNPTIPAYPPHYYCHLPQQPHPAHSRHRTCNIARMYHPQQPYIHPSSCWRRMLNVSGRLVDDVDICQPVLMACGRWVRLGRDRVGGHQDSGAWHPSYFNAQYHRNLNAEG